MKKKKNEFFERLMKGMQEGIQHLRGEIQLRTYVLESPDPPPALKPQDIVHLRQRFKMTQDMFGRVINVSTKTVQSWEQGERRPSQASLRLLQIMAEKPDVVCEVVGIRNSVNGAKH